MSPTNEQLEKQLEEALATIEKLKQREELFRATEVALSESEKKFKTLIMTSNDSIQLLDGDVCITCNPAALKLYGCDDESQLIGYTPRDFSPPTQPDGTPSRIKSRQYNTATLEGKPQRFYWKGLRRDGTPMDTDISLNRLELGGKAYIQVIGRDITERKESEEHLNRLAMAIEQVTEAVIITDPKGKISYVNPAFEKISGFGPDDVLDERTQFLASSDQDERIYMELWKAISEGLTWSGRLINRRKTGEPYTAEVSVSPVFDSAGKIINYVSIIRDITEELDMEKRLLQAQKMEAVGQLAGGIAHDLNNLLQVIQGYSSIIQNKIDTSNPLSASLEQVLKAGESATELVRHLLTFSRRQVQQLESLDINHVINNFAKMIKRIIGEHITLDVIQDEDLPMISADREQVGQILMNLCVNSRDAMPHGGKITISTQPFEIDTEFSKNHPGAIPGLHILLKVSDTGHGMTEEIRSHLFEPFFTTKEVGTGTGLGLATVYGIVKQHKGIISVYSEVDHGTTVNIFFPIDTGVPATARKEARSPPPGGTDTILLAEDDPAVREFTAEVLKSAGYKVFAAGDGHEALRIFEVHKDEIALLLLDVVMPGLGGQAVCSKIRQKHPDIRVLFTSGYSPDAARSYFDSLKDGVIQKPFQTHELLNTVRETLDQ
jgi:PAS domain S-box-containing protein